MDLSTRSSATEPHIRGPRKDNAPRTALYRAVAAPQLTTVPRANSDAHLAAAWYLLRARRKNEERLINPSLLQHTHRNCVVMTCAPSCWTTCREAAVTVTALPSLSAVGISSLMPNLNGAVNRSIKLCPLLGLDLGAAR